MPSALALGPPEDYPGLQVPHHGFSRLPLEIMVNGRHLDQFARWQAAGQKLVPVSDAVVVTRLARNSK